MGQGLFQRIDGNEGQIKLLPIGAVVGILGEWSLVRRRARDGDGYDDEGLYDLRATLTKVTRSLFHDADYTRDVRITVDKKSKKQYRVKCEPGFETTLNGNILLMEGVKLWPVE